MGEIIEYDFGKSRREVIRRFQLSVADWLKNDEIRRELAASDPFEFYRLFMQSYIDVRDQLLERNEAMERIRRIVDPASYGVTHCKTTHRMKLSRIHQIAFSTKFAEESNTFCD